LDLCASQRKSGRIYGPNSEVDTKFESIAMNLTGSNSQRDPLVAVGVSYLISDPAATKLTREAVDLSRTQIAKFLAGEIAYPEARASVQALTGTVSCIDQLFEILTLPAAPLTSFVTEVRCARHPSSATRRKTRPWTAQEDSRLLAGIHRFGLDKWPSVARFVGNARTRSQCSQRWVRGLDPRITKEEWTKEEENALLNLVSKYGNKSWMRIASELGNRADVQCRYRYMQIIRGTNTKISSAASEQSLPPIPVIPVKVTKGAVASSESMPKALTARPVEEAAGNLPLACAKNDKKTDPLFSSDFWVF
jgi:hypothetical protein